MDHLKVVEAGTVDGKVETAGTVDCRLTVEGDSNRSGGNGVSAAQNVKEAEGAEDASEFTPVGRLVFREAGRQIVADRLVAEGVAVRPWGHDKGGGAAAKVVNIGAITDDRGHPLPKGSG